MGVGLTPTRAFRQFQDYCHTGVSVQRRDRCTGMQQGAQLLLIYNCQVYRVSMPGPLPIQTAQTVGSHIHV